MYKEGFWRKYFLKLSYQLKKEGRLRQTSGQDNCRNMKYIIGIGGYRKDVTLKGRYLVRLDEGLETKNVTATQHRPPGLVKGQTGQYHSGQSW